MTLIFRIWYLASASWFYASFRHASQSIESSLAIRDTIKNLGRPLFQDYTFQGRIIGFMLRIARIGLGCLGIIALAICYIIAYALWLLFPLFCIVSLVGSFAGTSTQLTQGGV